MDHDSDSRLRFEELDEMEAPSWESFYQGAISALVLIGIGAAAAT
ncbi:MpaA1 family daptide-type RiPP [Microbacterium sp. 1.5R]|nr:MpaA1 family daptide-type RiPP [Microbacterium sp. 1.5R]